MHLKNLETYPVAVYLFRLSLFTMEKYVKNLKYTLVEPFYPGIVITRSLQKNANFRNFTSRNMHLPTSKPQYLMIELHGKTLNHPSP